MAEVGELRLPDVQPLPPGTQMPPSEDVNEFNRSMTGSFDGTRITLCCPRPSSSAVLCHTLCRPLLCSATRFAALGPRPHAMLPSGSAHHLLLCPSCALLCHGRLPSTVCHKLCRAMLCHMLCHSMGDFGPPRAYRALCVCVW